jgi:CBS domain containing-hemolysin-like protein
VEAASTWFLLAYLATCVLAAASAAFSTLLRVEPQAFEGESRGVLARLHEHWPGELALTLLLFPFLSMTAALVLGSLRFRGLTQPAEAADPVSGRALLLWLGLTLLILVTVSLFRSLGMRYPATLTRLLGWIFVPAFFLLYPFSRLFGSLLGRLKLTRGLETLGPLISAREVQEFVGSAGGVDVLGDGEREMISSIVEMRDTPVREVMIPRIDMKLLDIETPIAEARAFTASCGHSRVPVYKGSSDHVVGILYAKDLLRIGNEPDAGSLIQLIRKPYFVPETKMVADLLRRFQEVRQHMAIVVDEYGGTAGIVTLEDLLEEIVGEIRDEFDQDENLFELIGEDSARVDAKIDLEELGEILDHEFEEIEEDFESLGGLLLYHSGRILKPGDELSLDPFIFRVESVQRQRIAKVILIRPGLAAAVRERGKGEEVSP